ncbi:MAG: hypothetical protein FJ403_14095 [Verrucomicrobia bacterium]|nr:hypothetical protein [Verrucomicrobiota bacterium]
MDTLLDWLARCILRALQFLPLPWAARLGRIGGEICYWCDIRHRRVALRNLKLCFAAERTARELRALARENFRRIGENYASGAKTAFMSFEELKPFVEFVGAGKLASNRSVIIALGHFGNFELFARIGHLVPQLKPVATYRGLPHPVLNRLLLSLRSRSGCTFFERRTDADALKAALRSERLLLGLLADQHAGRRGLRLPFLGHDCSTSAAPAVFALRYNCHLATGFCFRVGLAQWRVEVGEEIPTRANGSPRPVEAIMRDVNQSFERAVRRDPANWFWVHNRWKPARRIRNSGRSRGSSNRDRESGKSEIRLSQSEANPKS